MSDEDPKPLKPVVLQPGEGGPKPGKSSGVERTDVPPTAPRRQPAVWDVALSVVLMFFSLVAFFTGSVIGLLGIALFGSCQGGTCSGGAVTTTGLVLLVVLIVGIVATIAALRLRFRGWWIAAVMLGTIVVGWVVSYALSAFGV